jgi:hypothetical protein
VLYTLQSKILISILFSSYFFDKFQLFLYGWLAFPSSVTVDPTIKLLGAGAFAFHPTLEWVFIGDRGGTLLAWDVSTERPTMIGM